MIAFQATTLIEVPGPGLQVEFAGRCPPCHGLATLFGYTYKNDGKDLTRFRIHDGPQDALIFRPSDIGPLTEKHYKDLIAMLKHSGVVDVSTLDDPEVLDALLSNIPRASAQENSLAA